jgi:ubiquinone/menaquinone biosynthesis C-methylase UbiE
MAHPALAGGFPDVDRTADPGAFVRYLDAVGALGGTRAYKRFTYALLAPRPGDRLLDAGCGTGDDARALARLVGPAGRVVGIDRSRTMIAEARRRSVDLGLSAEFRSGDVRRLDLADATFDGCRADRTLQHVDDPRAALAELVRVARPGARLVVSEPDWGTLVVDAPDRALTRAILDAHCDGHRSGWVGRRLYGLFKEAGLAEVAVAPLAAPLTDYALATDLLALEQVPERARAAGAVTAAEAAAWLDSLAAAHRAGRFFGTVTLSVVSGRRG